jgi:hypothetical protein
VLDVKRLYLLAAATIAVTNTAQAFPEPPGGQLFSEIEIKVVQSCLGNTASDLCQAYLHGLGKGMGLRCKVGIDFVETFADTLQKLRTNTDTPPSEWRNMDGLANRHLFRWCPEGFSDPPRAWDRSK